MKDAPMYLVAVIFCLVVGAMFAAARQKRKDAQKFPTRNEHRDPHDPSL